MGTIGASDPLSRLELPTSLFAPRFCAGSKKAFPELGPNVFGLDGFWLAVL
jgi:hypothetical protein